MGFKLLLTSSLLVASSSALEIGNITSIDEDFDNFAHSFWGSVESVTTRKSRKKTTGFESKPLMKYPNGKVIKTPTVIFHGVR